MSIIGKFHEISFYGLISAIVCLVTRKTSFGVLCGSCYSSGLLCDAL